VNAVDEALDTVAAAISKAARDFTVCNVPVPKAHAEALLDLANAAAALKFGPQGYSGRVDYDYRNHTDYHYTTRNGDARQRATGFGP